MTTKSASRTKQDAFRELGLSPEQLPRHVAIIMDGNGRWATSQGWLRIEGHRQGVKSVRRTVEECCRLGIDQLTLYCLSIENWKRPKIELNQLMRLLRQYLIDERPLLMDENVKLKVIGRREGLPDSVLNEMNKTIELTASNTGMTLCLAINYGGRTEILDAVRALAEKVRGGELSPELIDEKAIEDALYTGGMEDPDLLIRTAGEMRVSNFLLWQISYSEIFVTETCWPDFSLPHLQEALRNYARRERRFGGLIEPRVT